jgi:poly-gamma-glutamate system protein
MTTLGSLESKRLATDPRWAAALVHQFAGRGLTPGAVVLASFSGSFPGLNLAVMAACRAMDLRLVAISSVTASTWGANEPGFTWPEIEGMVVRGGVLPAASVAVSVGGTRDNGRDLEDEGRAIAQRIQRESAQALGARVLSAPTLEEAIGVRLAAYRSAIGGARPAAYVNVGGSHASLGGARAPFRHEEGWLTSAPASNDASASVLAAWLAEGVPALNLLDVKTLAVKWGLMSQ